MRINEDFIDAESNFGDVISSDEVDITEDDVREDAYPLYLTLFITQLPRFKDTNWYFDKLFAFRRLFLSRLKQLPFISKFQKEPLIYVSGECKFRNDDYWLPYKDREITFQKDSLGRCIYFNITMGKNVPDAIDNYPCSYMRIGLDAPVNTIPQIQKLNITLFKIFENCLKPIFTKSQAEAFELYISRPYTNLNNKDVKRVSSNNVNQWMHPEDFRNFNFFMGVWKSLHPETKKRDIEDMLTQIRDKTSNDKNKDLIDQARKAVYYAFGDPRIDNIEVKNETVYFYISRPLRISQPGHIIEKMNRYEHPNLKIVNIPKLTISMKFEIWDENKKDFDFSSTQKLLNTYFLNIGEVVFVIPNELSLCEKYNGETIDIASQFPNHITDFKLQLKDKEEIFGCPFSGHGWEMDEPDELIDKTYSFTVITSKKTKKVTLHIVQKIYHN